MDGMSDVPPERRVTHCAHCRQRFRDLNPRSSVFVHDGVDVCYPCWDRLTGRDPSEAPNLRPVALEALASGSTGPVRTRLRTL
jgi:hypothetical protein